jgi:predicted ATPase
MLETVRELALEEFARDPEESTIRRRHCDWFRQLAQSLAPTLTGKPSARRSPRWPASTPTSARRWSTRSRPGMRLPPSR